MNVEEVLRQNGLGSLKVGKFEKNPESQKAAVIEALKNKSLGKDVLGESVKISESQAHGLYGEMFDKKGGVKNPLLSGVTVREQMHRMKADVKKTHGKVTAINGQQTGIGFGWQGNRVASGGAHLASSVVDTARVVGESSLNSLGLMTRQQQSQFKYGSALSKAMAVAPAAFSLYNNVSTLLDGGDIGDAMAVNMIGIGAMAGVHMGKSLAGATSSGVAAGLAKMTGNKGPRSGGAGVVTKNATTGVTSITGGKLRIGAQFVGGAIGGGLGTLAASAISLGVSDMTSSESSIAKAARSYSQLSSTANFQHNNQTLTMRQRSLQQLSQSALNDRGALLGNEAAILKNIQ